MKKVFPLLILSCLFLFCNQSSMVEVVKVGEMESLFKRGEMQTRLNLAELKNIPNLYAIGTLTDLKGYIQIFNGKPYSSVVNNDSVLLDTSMNMNATMLLYSTVDDWRGFELPNSVKTLPQLEQHIRNLSLKYEKHHADVIPVLMEGYVAQLDWQVINWTAGDKNLNMKKLSESGKNGTLTNEYVQIVGFYSQTAHKIFTYKDDNVHLHFVNQQKSLAGHVNDLQLNGNITLYLPNLPNER